MKKHTLDQLFAKKLGNLEAEPVKAGWEAMEAMLSKQEKKEKKPLWWWWSAAAVILLSIGFWLGQGFDNKQNKHVVAVAGPDKDSISTKTHPEPTETMNPNKVTEKNTLRENQNPAPTKPYKPKKVRVSGYYAKAETPQKTKPTENKIPEHKPEPAETIALNNPKANQAPEAPEIAFASQPPAETVDQSFATIEYRPAKADEDWAEVSVRPRESAGRRLINKVKSIRNGETSIRDLGINRQTLISLVTNRNDED
jgi:hypothetical protein